MRRLGRWLPALALSACAAAMHAGEFVPCAHNRPGDAGLRVLVETVYANDANTQSVQRVLGWPLTPLRGRPEDVDELAWCRCVHRERVKALGAELAVSMSVLDPRETVKYDTWLKSRTPQQQREHVAFNFTTSAVCFNESRKRR